MKEQQTIFLAYSFGDYEGVRQYLDTLARQGWELTGRSGWLTGKIQPTQRTELHYDVEPAPLQRSQSELEGTVEQRRKVGWEPVDTVWGMDIYKSMPCQQPARAGDFYEQAGKTFTDWIIRSGVLILLSGVALLVNRDTLRLSTVSNRWYLYDSKAAAVILLPVIGVLGVLFLLWMAVCRLSRCRAHKPSGLASMRLRAGLQLALIGAFALLVVILWLSSIPRLWVRILLFVLFLLVLPAAHLVGRENQKRRILIAGAGIFGLFFAVTILGFVIKPIGGALFSQAESRGLPGVITSEELGLEAQVTARYFDLEDQLLVRQSRYLELWEEGGLEVVVYDCRLGGIGELLLRDLGLENLNWGEVLLQEGEDQTVLWLRQGSRVTEIRGPSELTQQEIQEKILGMTAN